MGNGQAGNRLANPLGHLAGTFAGRAGEQHGEFLSTITRHQITGTADGAADRLCDTPQTFVPHGMPVAIVVSLEVIHIDQDQRQIFQISRLASRLGSEADPVAASPLLHHRLIEAAPIGHVCQSVHHGHPLQRVVDACQLGRTIVETGFLILNDLGGDTLLAQQIDHHVLLAPMNSVDRGAHTPTDHHHRNEQEKNWGRQGHRQRRQ